MLSDSDMVVGPGLCRLRNDHALARPGVGAVTLPYAGIGETNGWSTDGGGRDQLGLPAQRDDRRRHKAWPTPAWARRSRLRRETLEAIGGFAPFADLLADDHAIGAAVRALGLERRGRAADRAPRLQRIEPSRRSGATSCAGMRRCACSIRRVMPAARSPTASPGALLAVACGRGRLGDRRSRCSPDSRSPRGSTRSSAARPRRLWWLPVRDLLSFGLYCTAFFTRSVDWRGKPASYGIQRSRARPRRRIFSK